MEIIKFKFKHDKSKFKNFDLKGIVAAIGNFDGFHKGHQKLLKEAKILANKRLLPFSIISFAPHPREFFLKKERNFKLTDNLEKERLIKQFNTKIYIEITFDEELRCLEPSQFIKLILNDHFNVKVLFAGENFKFGRNRSGTLINQKKLFKKLNIEPRICKLEKYQKNDIISSESIRENIRSSNLKSVFNSLGRNWAITGKVEQGNRVGSKLGFPTANLVLREHIKPKFGVYLSNTYIMSDDGQDIISQKLYSITNFGVRPTVDGEKELLETHILNMDKELGNYNLYDKRIYVELISYLRPEKKFNSLDELKEQIRLDINHAKELL